MKRLRQSLALGFAWVLRVPVKIREDFWLDEAKPLRSAEATGRQDCAPFQTPTSFPASVR